MTSDKRVVILALSFYHARESLGPAPAPFYITAEAYRDCGRARPDVDWSGFESKLEIQISRNAEGKSVVTIHEETSAAKAIREAMMATGPEDFGP